jgi:hypothetical protein
MPISSTFISQNNSDFPSLANYIRAMGEMKFTKAIVYRRMLVARGEGAALETFPAVHESIVPKPCLSVKQDITRGCVPLQGTDFDFNTRFRIRKAE